MSKRKTNTQIIKNNVSTESNEYKKLIMLIAIIAGTFLLFYFVTLIFTKKEDKDSIFKNDLEATEIQYDEIIVGTMFNQNQKEYYVLLEEENDQYKELFDSYITTIRTGKEKIYTIDLTNGFNKTTISDKATYNKDDFKVKGTTLIKINDKKIVEHYENKDKIAEVLKKEAKEVSK